VSRLGLEVQSLGVYPLGPRSSSCGPTKGTPGTAQSHSKDHLRLTLYKLTDWLASLDLHKPYTSRIRLASRDPPRLIPLSINIQGSLVPRVPTLFFCFCLFVGINPEKLYSVFCGGREVNPLGVATHGQRHKTRACQRLRYKPRTCQSQLWLTLYKLTGWLASLDLVAPTQRLILSHRTASPHALYDTLVLDGGRGKTMSDLVDSDRELPVNF